MSHEAGRPEDLKAVEAALAALVPRGDRLQRDRLMYLAGQAAASRPALSRRWAWPAAFSAMTAVAASLLAMVVIRPGPQIVERIVEVPVPAAPDGGQGAAKAGGLLAAEKSGYSLPEFAPGRRSNGTALAYGPLALLRSPGLSGRLDSAPDAAWLDQILPPSTGSHNLAPQGAATQPSAETPIPYGELRERLLERSADRAETAPLAPGVFGFHGDRS